MPVTSSIPSAPALTRSRIGAVRIRLPSNGTVVANLDKLVLEAGTGRDTNSSPPERVALRVSVSQKRPSVGRVPGAELLDATDDLDAVTPHGRSQDAKVDLVQAGGRSGLWDTSRDGLGTTRGLASREANSSGGNVGTVGGRRGAGVGELRRGGEPAELGAASVGAGRSGSEEGGVGPGEITGGHRCSVVLAELLRHGAVAVHVRLDDVQVAIGIRENSIEDGVVGGGAVLIGSRCDGGDEVLEETERSGRDGDGTLGLPDGNGVVELLSGGEGQEVPGIAVVVNILDVSADGDSGALRDAVINGPGPERVRDGLVVREGLVAAWLESGSVAAETGVERMDGTEDTVAILASATGVVVDCSIHLVRIRRGIWLTRGRRHTVRNHVARVGPVVLNQAENMRSDLIAGRASGLEPGGKSAALDESSILGDGGEERGTVHFLPEVESGVIPRSVSLGQS